MAYRSLRWWVPCRSTGAIADLVNINRPAAPTAGAAQVDTPDEVIGRYLPQIWPEDEATPRTIKSTSGQLAYWRGPR